MRTDQQAAGRSHVACGATHGVMEHCDFACSSCYLTPIANRTRPLPFEEVRKQLDVLRDGLGPQGKVQITAGEVTLLDPPELGRIVSYARKIGLDPMVMTNGQRFEEVPGYLASLVRDHGLQKVAFHVDVTQHGRKGDHHFGREAALHKVRDRFAAMIRMVRKETGRRLHGAHTVTVTGENLDQVPDIVQWALENHDAFRMISFQPVADVGRTRDLPDPGVSLDSVWTKIREAVGVPLNRFALQFGHPSCNIVCPLFVITLGERREIIQCVPEGDSQGRKVMSRLLSTAGGLPPLGSHRVRGVLRIAAALRSRPGLPSAAAAGTGTGPIAAVQGGSGSSPDPGGSPVHERR
ncbi:MAG: radical SAM protein [Acidobacteria bacterium]|uniref:Radical SAM protein n=1 Tax=Candidatus Polarisedimenticola svalbardensis TaxID=2886004 RepID=A0A8J6XRR0_9BACT|nr:radical SAM protein [Candidatus Polarisedimenticola svalbardensis]